MTLCSRCGGIISDQQTVHYDGENAYHYYCSWKNWQEHKEALMKVDSEKTQVGFFNSNWLTKK